MTLSEAMSFIDWLINKAVWIFILFWFISLILNYSPLGRDDSDKSNWGERSGLSVRIDAKTGIEYLVTSGGGIIRRGTND